MSEKKELDLEAIEATLAALPRIPRLPAYFQDMQALVREVKRLRARVDEQADEIKDLQQIVELYRTLYRGENDVEVEGVPV